MRWIDCSLPEAPIRPVVAQMLLLRGKRPGSSSEERQIASKVALKLNDFAAVIEMLGDDLHASRLVDLDRQVKQRSISEVFSSAEIKDFHRQLIDETKAAVPLADDQSARIDYRPNVDPNLGDVSLLYSVIKLRNEARNGQHVHRQSIVAGVYHLLVADNILEAPDDRGCLEIGNVDQHTKGHKAIWGRRLIKPTPGQFTMFPAHIFHDVIPTHSSALRLSIPMDVQVMSSTASD